MPLKIDLLFGKVALAESHLTVDQLKECIRIQRENPRESLPTIATEKGYLDVGLVQEILRTVTERMLEGEEAEDLETLVGERLPAPAGGPPAEAAAPAVSVEALDRPNDKIKDVGVDVTEEGLVRGEKVEKLAEGRLEDYLAFAREIGASDLHITSGGPPFVRHHGRIRRLDLPIQTAEEVERIVLPGLDDKQREVFQARNDIDFALHRDGIGRFRTNCFRHRKGISGVFRVIPDAIPTLQELNLPDVLEQFTTVQVGIVLITGPAGCGKSSTMAALVEIINQHRKDHIVTVEDPIEFVFQSKKANVTQRQVEMHTKSWGIALRAALREDPDVIMVGELRDLDTISTAVTAAETGHLVLGTLHTTNATRTVDRIIDVFPPKQQEQIRAMVSESIRGVICQQLIPRADGRGRIPALEILISNPAVGNLIREKRTYQLISVLQTGRNQGMIMMDDSIQQLLDRGLITEEEAIFRAQDPTRFLKGRDVRAPIIAG